MEQPSTSSPKIGLQGKIPHDSSKFMGQKIWDDKSLSLTYQDL